MKSIAILVASLAVVTAFAPQQNVASSSTKLEALADQVRTFQCMLSWNVFTQNPAELFHIPMYLPLNIMLDDPFYYRIFRFSVWICFHQTLIVINTVPAPRRT
jgi:hypothetical protein